MTAHRWEEFTPENHQLAMSTFGSRRCLNCSVVQHKEQQTSWMRVTGYRWWPLAGRCKGKQMIPEENPAQVVADNEDAALDDPNSVEAIKARYAEQGARNLTVRKKGEAFETCVKRLVKKGAS